MASLESILLMILGFLVGTVLVAIILIFKYPKMDYLKRKKKKFQNKMIKDKIINKIYQFMSIKRYFLKTKSIECKIGNEYKICFYDDFTNDTIGKNWLRSHEWGFYHPENLTQY